MGTFIVIAVLVVIIIVAVINSSKHFKGEGGCCGGSSEKKVRPKKIKNVVKTLEIDIEGMSCDNCKKRIENHLNSIESVNAKVSLKHNKATVQLGEGVDENTAISTIEKLGYKATLVK